MGVSRAPVHVIDDYEPMRSALGHFLTAADLAPHCYASAEEFLASPNGAAGGSLVADFHLPQMSGLDLVHRLRSEGDLRPIILMSGQADIGVAVQAMKAGAADFLEKPFTASAFIAAVRAAGGPGPAMASAPPLGVLAYREVLETLSPRQRDVLAGILAGKVNKAIAHHLGLSVRTVEGYRAELMARAGARRLSDLVRMGVLASL